MPGIGATLWLWSVQNSRWTHQLGQLADVAQVNAVEGDALHRLEFVPEVYLRGEDLKQNHYLATGAHTVTVLKAGRHDGAATC